MVVAAHRMAFVLVNPDEISENPGSTRTGCCLSRESKKRILIISKNYGGQIIGIEAVKI